MKHEAAGTVLPLPGDQQPALEQCFSLMKAGHFGNKTTESFTFLFGV